MSEDLSYQEHFEIARALEVHHALFERVWSMGRIRFSKRIPTAGVLFNKKGDCIDFILNKRFWEGLSFVVKCFVISHECFHIALNHGVRTRELLTRKLKKISNIAQDLVINHALVNLYGYKREEVDPDNKYCWVDTVFKPLLPETFADDENYEYYYNILLRMSEENPEEFQKMTGENETVDDHDIGDQIGEEGEPGEGEGDGEGDGDGEGKGNKGEEAGDPGDLDPDEFDYFDPDEYSDDFSDAIDKLNEDLTGDEKDTIENFINENENSSGDPKENPEAKPTGTSKPSKKGGGKQAGTTAGTGWTFAKEVKNPRKHKFEHIITSWARKKLNPEYIEEDQWVHKNRRFSMVGNDSMYLPTEYETLNRKPGIDKIEVWFFQDTSGSCSGYTDRFFGIAEGMPLDKFNMRMFCFDTKVYETNLIDRKLYGFGGTYFSILEERIQEELANDPKFRYPEAVFVVTDGYGNDIVPDKPKNWHWILTPDGSRDCIPEDCSFYDLADYETVEDT